MNQLPMSGSTQMPPCGARSVVPKAIASAPVTAEPTTEEAMTRPGSAAAKGMAPSEMKDAPSNQAALPFSCSGSVKSLGRSVVASAIASGATMPAAMTAAMILSCGASVASADGGQAGGAEGVGDLVDRAAEVEAHHRAEDEAQGDAAAAAQPLRPVARASMSALIGRPRTVMNRPRVMSVDSSGVTTTGMTPRTPLCTFQPEIQRATNRRAAGHQAAEEAGAHGRGDRAADDAGHQAGPVGDRIGDEAGQDRHEEAEGGRTDDEQQCRPVHAR
jgi:hypothetical protein